MEKTILRQKIKSDEADSINHARQFVTYLVHEKIIIKWSFATFTTI